MRERSFSYVGGRCCCRAWAVVRCRAVVVACRRGCGFVVVVLTALCRRLLVSQVSKGEGGQTIRTKGGDDDERRLMSSFAVGCHVVTELVPDR